MKTLTNAHSKNICKNIYKKQSCVIFSIVGNKNTPTESYNKMNNTTSNLSKYYPINTRDIPVKSRMINVWYSKCGDKVIPHTGEEMHDDDYQGTGLYFHYEFVEDLHYTVNGKKTIVELKGKQSIWHYKVSGRFEEDKEVIETFQRQSKYIWKMIAACNYNMQKKSEVDAVIRNALNQKNRTKRARISKQTIENFFRLYLCNKLCYISIKSDKDVPTNNIQHIRPRHTFYHIYTDVEQVKNNIIQDFLDRKLIRKISMKK